LLVSSCLRRIGGLVVFSLALALMVAPSAGAALPGGYSASPADGIGLPSRTPDDGAFGSTMANLGGLLLVGVPEANAGQGAIVLVNPYDPAQTQRIDVPLEPSRVEGEPTHFGASVAAIPDIGKCQQPTTQPGQTCAPTATPDGVPDFLVGAPGANVNNTQGGIDLGRVYVFDGSTRGVMKRIQIAPRSATDPIPGAPLAGKPDFGESVSSLSGTPPCLGAGGLTACPGADRVTKGDIDGDGIPDIAIGAPLYRESEDSSLACQAPTGQACPPTGRIYVVKGADLTTPGEVTALSDESHYALGVPTTYPYSDADSSATPQFGASIVPLGDVGSCDTSGVLGAVCPADHVRNAPDGVPDLLISGTGVDAGAIDAGAAFVLDGGSGTILSRLQSISPVANAAFGTFSSGEAAFGDLIDSPLPDIYVGAPGRAESDVFTGDGTLPLASRLWASTPVLGAGFGVSSAPAGDVAGDSPGELLIGDTGANAVHVFSACANAIVQTIGAPAGAGGFGAAVVSVGDVNGDGYPDFAAGAPSAAGATGRVFLMTSNGSPGPGVVPCHPGGGGGGGGGGGTAAGGGGGSTGPTPPPSDRKRTRALAVRRITISANKKKVKAGAPIALSGTLRAAKKRPTCQRRQKVAIQRMPIPGKYWATIDVAITRKDGKFLSTTNPGPANTSFYYRARVNRTKRCAAAASNRVKVRAMR
jgi:FG-GAP repeat